MKDFISDDEMMRLENPDFISDEEMKKLESPSYDWSNAPKDLAKSFTEALPIAGGAVGGLVGLVGGPAGSVAGAGLGAAGGKALENIIEANFFNEAKTPKDVFVDPLVAGAVGAAGEAGGMIAGKALQAGLKSLQPSMSTQAERMAARALGAERGTIKKLGADKVQEVGRFALDEGILTPFSNTDDLIAANAAAQARGGKMMGDVYSAIDEKAASTFNPLDVATKVDTELGGFYRDPLNKGVTNQLENTLESIMMRGEKNIPLSEAQKLKETLGQAANWKNNLVVSEKENLARQAYGIVNKAIDDAVEAGAKAIGTDEILYNLQKGKGIYSASKAAEELLTNKQAREQGNKLIGLTDWGVLGTGGAAIPFTGGGSIPVTAGIYGAKKYGEKYGAQQAALGLDKLSKSLLSSPYMQQVSKTKPQLFSQMVSRLGQLSQMQDEQKPAPAVDRDRIFSKTQGSKYSQVLQKAASNGDQSFNAAHYVLHSNNPEYRQLLEEEQ